MRKPEEGVVVVSVVLVLSGVSFEVIMIVETRRTSGPVSHLVRKLCIE